MKKKLVNKKELYELITIVIIILIIVYFDFFIFNKVYVYNDVGSDTFDSYFPMYRFIVNKFKGGLGTTFMLEMGIGTSLFTLSSFLTDPFIIFLFLFNDKFFPLGIFLICIFKYIGIAIIMFMYLQKIGFSNYISKLGALAWTFSSYSILWGQHYHFLTVYLLFTILLYSFEIYLEKDKKVFFIFSLTALLINSIYFSFMIGIFLIFYFIWRYYYNKSKTKIKPSDRGLCFK